MSDDNEIIELACARAAEDKKHDIAFWWCQSCGLKIMKDLNKTLNELISDLEMAMAVAKANHDEEENS